MDPWTHGPMDFCRIHPMSRSFSRRDLLKTAAALPMATLIDPSKARGDDVGEQAAAGQATAAVPPVRIKRAVLVSMLPEKLSWKERFALAKDIGFDGIEMQTMEDQAAAAEVARASQETGLVIHSVMNMAHWKYPISSPDPDVVRKSVAGMKTSLTNAALWKAEIVLLVPAVVNPATSYADAWARSTQVIKEQLVPLADGFKVKIGIEEVWNKFLLSPLEFTRYIDEFRSPWIKAYMDVGNVVLYGYPQDWIRTLGKRISSAPEGFPRRPRERQVRVEEHRRGRHRLAGRARRPGRRAIRHLVHDRAGRRRSRVPDRRAGAGRSFPRRVQTRAGQRLAGASGASTALPPGAAAP